MLTILPLSAPGETLPVVGGNPVLPLMAQETRRHCVVTITGSRQAVLLVPGSSVEVCAKQAAPETPPVKPAEKPSMPAAKKAHPPVALPKTPVPKADGEQVEKSHKRPRKTSPFDEHAPYRPWVHLPEPRDQRRPTPKPQTGFDPLRRFDFVGDTNAEVGVKTDVTVLTNAGVHAEFDPAAENPKLVTHIMGALNLTLEEAKAKVREAFTRGVTQTQSASGTADAAPAQKGLPSPLQPSEKSVPTATLPRNKPMKNIGVNGNVVLVEADVPSVAYDDVPMDIRQIFHSSGRVRTVFEAILKYGHDEDFSPSSDQDFVPTDAAPGSVEKMEVLACRLQLGLPLWHPEDRVDFSNLIGAIRPRDD